MKQVQLKSQNGNRVEPIQVPNSMPPPPPGTGESSIQNNILAIKFLR